MTGFIADDSKKGAHNNERNQSIFQWCLLMIQSEGRSRAQAGLRSHWMLIALVSGNYVMMDENARLLYFLLSKVGFIRHRS